MLRAALLVGASALILGACSEEGTLTSQGPELFLDTESIDFGAVPIGASRRIRVEVSNRGQQRLELREVRLSAPFTVDVEATTLAPGAAAVLDVGFAPDRVDEVSGALEILSNDGSEPVFVSVRGSGLQAVLRGFPDEIDFGSVRLQESAEREIVLATNTAAPVEGQIRTDSFVREEHWAMTFVSRFGDEASFSLGGLDERVLSLTYRPFIVGPDDGRILFEFCGDRCGVWVDVRATAVESRMRIEPAVLDFGLVGIDESSTEQIVVSNVGQTPFTVESVRIEGTDEVDFTSDNPLPATVQPNGFITLRVTYAPFAARELAGTLVVATDEPEIGERDVALVGGGAGPRFEVLPSTLQFGVVDEAPSRRILLLANSGSSSLSVETIELLGDSDFSLVSPPPTPLRLGPGDTAQLDVQLEPSRTGTFTATVTVTTDDPALAEARVPVRAFRGDRLCRLEPIPDSVNFGVVSPGWSRTATVTLSNVGNDACAIQSVSLREPADPFFSLVEAERPASLAPGESFEVAVTLAPTEDRDVKASLVVSTNDPLAPRQTVNLLGTARTYTDVFVRPEQIDLGTIRADCNVATDSVLLLNAGDGSVEVASVELVPPPTETEVSGPDPVRVNAGGSATWGVEWQPSVPGAVETDIVLSFTELPFPLRVPVTGQASLDARSVDRFEQRDIATVDVLFVIDNSCSMADDQAALAANADTFIREADSQEVRYRIGVTTTSDWPDQGRLVGDVIDRDQMSRSEVIAEFGRQALVGTGGSGIEEGAASLVAALRKAQRGNLPNADLLRPDASLVLIIVTDEDDSSPSSMVRYYRDIIDIAPGDVVMAIVSGGPSGCGTALPTPRYQQLLDLTEGDHISICADWGRNLQALGRAAFAPRNEFELRAEPEPTIPVEVRVDGQLLPTGDWTVAAGSRTVVFEEAPPPRAAIEVSYVPRCQ